MAITINGIVCQELARPDGLQEQVDLLAGPSARKGFVCNWNDRYTVAKGLLGLTAASSIGGVITLNYPAQYPEIPTSYCHRISFEPVGSPTQGTAQVQWPKVIVWAEYGRLPFFANGFNQITPVGQQPNNLIFAEQRLSSTCEWVTVPGSFTKFVTSGKPLQQDAGIRLALVEIEIRFPNMPTMPTNATILAAGSINNAQFFGFGTGHLTYNGVQTETTANYDGNYAQTGVYSFSGRTLRWDYAFDLTTGAFDRLTYADGTAMYTLYDFTTILPQYIA